MTHDVTANANADEGGREGPCVLYLHAAQAPLRLLPPPIKQTTDRASLLFSPVHLEFRRVEDGDGVDGVGHVVELKLFEYCN